MSQNDQQGLDGMDEHQSPSPADAGASDQEAAISGNGGTPGANRLGMRAAPDDLTGEQAPRGDTGMNATLSEAGMGAGDSGAPGTRANPDRSGVPGGGLAEGMDSGNMTGTSDQADARQEGANIQP